MNTRLTADPGVDDFVMDRAFFRPNASRTFKPERQAVQIKPVVFTTFNRIHQVPKSGFGTTQTRGLETTPEP